MRSLKMEFVLQPCHRKMGAFTGPGIVIPQPKLVALSLNFIPRMKYKRNK